MVMLAPLDISVPATTILAAAQETMVLAVTLTATQLQAQANGAYAQRQTFLTHLDGCLHVQAETTAIADTLTTTVRLDLPTLVPAIMAPHLPSLQQAAIAAMALQEAITAVLQAVTAVLPAATVHQAATAVSTAAAVLQVAVLQEVHQAVQAA